MNVNPNKRQYYYHRAAMSDHISLLILHPTKQDRVDEWYGALFFKDALENKNYPLETIIQHIEEGLKHVSYYPKSECYKTLKQAQNNER